MLKGIFIYRFQILRIQFNTQNIVSLNTQKKNEYIYIAFFKVGRYFKKELFVFMAE